MSKQKDCSVAIWTWFLRNFIFIHMKKIKFLTSPSPGPTKNAQCVPTEAEGEKYGKNDSLFRAKDSVTSEQRELYGLIKQ